MAGGVVLQKMLTADMSRSLFDRGNAEVCGIVTQAGDAVTLNTPAALLAAYGFEGNRDIEYVDVVRFDLPACATLRPAVDTEPRAWPTYPNGFLRPVGDALVPVWELSWTRYSPRSECWRIHRDGSQGLVSAYPGAAEGWIGATQWQPVSRLVGPRATWNGVEYAADVAGDQVELIAYTDPGSPQWAQRRFGSWSRVAPLAECEVFEIVCTAVVAGVPVRVLEVRDGVARVHPTGADYSQAQSIGATMIDQGVFELRDVPVGELGNLQTVANQLARHT